MQIVRMHLEEMRRVHKTHEHEPDQMAMGKCEAYEEWPEQLLPQMAEVRTMIDRFAK